MIGFPPAQSVTCAPNTLSAGASATCSYTLTAPAPTGGETLKVASSSALLSVPTTTSVAAAATAGSFAVTALAGYTGPVTVTLTVTGVSASTTISSAQTGRKPKRGDGSPVSAVPEWLSCLPKSAVAGTTLSCEVQLSSAYASGAELRLASGDATIHVPEAVRSRPHQSTLSFQAYVDKSASGRSVSLMALAGGAVAEDRIGIQAGSDLVLSIPAKQFVSIGSHLSFRVGAFSQSGATPALTADSLPSGSRFEASTGTFEWTPESSQTGSWDVVFTAKDDAQRSSTGHALIRVGSGRPVIESLQNAANGSVEVVCSTGSLATLKGGWLSGTTASDASGETAALGGATVIVNGMNTPVVFASPERVTFACPNAASGTPLTIAVETGAGRSEAVTTLTQDAALGVFTVDSSANGPADAKFEDSPLIAMPRNYRYAGQPAQPGDSLRIPVTGLSTEIDPKLVVIEIGGIQVGADWVRPASGALGITEIGVTLPHAVAPGDAAPLVVKQQRHDGRSFASQTAWIAIEAVRK